MKSHKPSQKTDLELVRLVQENPNNELALKELISRHSGIYVNIVTAYTPSNMLSHREELIAEKDYNFYQAALNFDVSKNTKFSTYVGNGTKWMCLNIYNKNKKRPEVAVDDLVLELNQEFEEFHSQSDRKDLLDHILDYVSSHSDPRVGEIFNLRYIKGQKNKVMPWKKVSSKINMSVQGCINIHDSIINKLKTKIQ